MDTPNKTLICTVGLPRSGKSTWSKSQGHPIVNPDSIRLAIHGRRFFAPAEPNVWAIAKTMVRALFLAGHDVVVLDACNNTRARRDDWRSSNEWNAVFHVINESAETCIERAESEGDREIIEQIVRMANAHEPLDEDESLWRES